MPKPKGGKSGKKKPAGSSKEKGELVLREPGMEYAQAGRMLGNGRLEAICFDGNTRLAHIRGKLLKRVWIATGDVILVALRDFQDNKVDVVYKYSADQIKQLKNMGEIPSNTKVANEVDLGDEDSDGVEFVFDEI